MVMRSFLSLGVLSALLLVVGVTRADDDYGPGISAKAEGGAEAKLKVADEEKVGDRAAPTREDRAEDSRAVRDEGAVTEERRDSSVTRSAAQPHPRQRFHNGRWWFLTEDNQWLYYENGRWVPYQQVQYAPQPQYYQGGNYQYGYQPQPYGYRYGSGYRGNYNGGYYGQGYYNGPGYGNRGWGNMNYGSRGANQGSNIGGAIDQGLGGSGQLGAGIGAAIGNQ